MADLKGMYYVTMTFRSECATIKQTALVENREDEEGTVKDFEKYYGLPCSQIERWRP